MARKKRTDSIDAQVAVVSKSFVNIEPPSHVRMTPEDMPFFYNVVAEFARSEWTQHALEIAALLARTLCDLEREQYELRVEGSISMTDRGTPVPNPRKTIVQMHSGTILSLRKSLGVDARGRGDAGRDIDKKKKLLKNIEDGVGDLVGDDLIARPFDA